MKEFTKKLWDNSKVWQTFVVALLLAETCYFEIMTLQTIAYHLSQGWELAVKVVLGTGLTGGLGLATASALDTSWMAPYVNKLLSGTNKENKES